MPWPAGRRGGVSVYAEAGCMKPPRHTRLKGVPLPPAFPTGFIDENGLDRIHEAVFCDQRKNLSPGAPLLSPVSRNAGTNLLRILRARGFDGAASHARGHTILQRRVPDGSRKAGPRRKGTPAARETPGRRSVTLEQLTLPDKRHLSVRLCAAARERRSPPKCGGRSTPAGKRPGRPPSTSGG